MSDSESETVRVPRNDPLFSGEGPSAPQDADRSAGEFPNGNCFLTMEVDPVECCGHSCVACGRRYYCLGPKHKCPPRPERTQAGIVRTPAFGERLSFGNQLLSQSEGSD